MQLVVPSAVRAAVTKLVITSLDYFAMMRGWTMARE